jgi:hypothetical protein
VFDALSSSVAELAPGAAADQERRLQETVDRLTAVAVKGDGWKQALRGSAQQDRLTGLADGGPCGSPPLPGWRWLRPGRR